ncbi:MAG: 4-alpha-glucanotransferase [Phycisphaerales bacterium]|nr:4-alpha-glucanotransferase [Phycisphaerales bacterium]
MNIAGNPMMAHRAAGVLCHLSSLAGPCAIGDLGPSAKEYVEWCSDAGFSWWQMLPVGPIGAGDSPYASTSSFAGEPLFISLAGLRDVGLLGARDVRESAAAAKRFARGSIASHGSMAKTNYDAARRAKEPAFLRAFESFRADGGFESAHYRAFAEREKYWLAGWRAFQNDGIGYHAFLQFSFDAQWQQLRSHARAHGVQLLGDVPIFVSLESADVAEHPQLFRLDRAGRPEVLTGVPPDCFSKDGQLWGHPHYRWSAHRADGFRWWTERIAASLRRFDGVRIDHFVGFHHAYEIPARAKTARTGRWTPQAGEELLAATRKKLGALSLIAEDLGAVTAEVVALRTQFDLPGMRVLHHAFGCDNSGDLLHRHESKCVVYPGTHDNDTTRGWYQSLSAASRQRFIAYCGADAARDPPEAMMRLAFASPAQLAIITMQDVLALDRSARMNLPGRAHGEWRWRLASDWRKQGKNCAKNIRALAALTGRIR